MSVNWKLMIQLRERQRAEASDRVAQERKVVSEVEARLDIAERKFLQEREAKKALWQRTNAAFQAGQCSVEQMQAAMAYSRTLDSRAAEAAKAVAEVCEEMKKKLAVLEARRGELRAAMGDLEKAKEMQVRHVKSVNRKIEARAEDVVDEWATSRWTVGIG